MAIHAWDLGDVDLGKRIAVVGAGPIGLLLVQMAANLGSAFVSVVEPLEHRREAALRCGADEVLEPAEVTPEMASFDVVFEVNGNPDAVETSIVLARAGGRVCLVGIPDGEHTTFTAATARRKGLTLMCVRRMKEVYPRAITLATRGIVDLDAVISDTFALGDVQAAFTHATSRAGLKTIITPSHP